jgi:hypothetical protein
MAFNVQLGNQGNKDDYVSVPYSAGDNSILAHLNTGYYHIHGTPFVYPNHADDVTLTAGSGAWDLTGSITEVIPAATLTTSAFDLHWINISSISANGVIQIDVYSGGAGSEVLISSVRASRNTVQSQEGAHRMQIPQQPSGTRISCRLSDSTAGSLTCNISFEGHYYAG